MSREPSKHAEEPNQPPEKSEDSFDESSFVFVDATGEPLAPEIEASCRMAADLATAEQGEATAEASAAQPGGNNDSLGGGMSLEPSSQWFGDDIRHAEEFLRANKNFFDAVGDDDDGDTDDADTEEGEDDSQEPSPANTTEPPSDEMDEDGGGMCSRLESDIGPDDEWILERVLKRRTVKRRDPQRGESSDLADAGPSEAVGKSSQAPRRVTEYLCKWKWYADATWEPREWLEDQGHVTALREFDEALAQAAKSEKPRKPRKNRNDVPTFDFDSYYPKNLEDMKAEFGRHNLVLSDYVRVAPKGATRRFVDRWRRDKEYCPVRLFHGTRTPCVRGIVDNGLCVPGQMGVRVLNGSAYGVGIYTARDPGYSAGYADHLGFMFICVGLVGSKFHTLTNDTGRICVFFDSSLVLPVWLVRFRRTCFQTHSYVDHPIVVHKGFKELMRATRFAPFAAFTFPAQFKVYASVQSDSDKAEHAKKQFAGKQITKKMLRQAPRIVKELYRTGELAQKR